MLIRDIIDTIEEFAPPALQEEYDNTGLTVGDAGGECTGVLLAVDVTPETVAEAIDEGCNLIVAHHPVIFRGLKRLTGATLVERTVIAAIRGGVAIYSCHTSVDNAPGGVSWQMARMLGLTDVEILDPKDGLVLKLVVFVPHDHCDKVKEAVFAAGAGRIGNYDSCCYESEGTGSYRPLDGAVPFAGTRGEVHREPETRLEFVLPFWRRKAVEKALLAAHPYEEPAYEFLSPVGSAGISGSGAAGILASPLDVDAFVALVKRAFGTTVVRCSRFAPAVPISKVAVCGGSGAFLIGKAIAAGAQAIVTSDTKHHDFVDYGRSILIADITHHESENCTKDIFYHVIKEKFPIFAVRYSKQDINPINYL